MNGFIYFTVSDKLLKILTYKVGDWVKSTGKASIGGFFNKKKLFEEGQLEIDDVLI